jgi:hypothetical protein
MQPPMIKASGHQTKPTPMVIAITASTSMMMAGSMFGRYDIEIYPKNRTLGVP